MSSLFRVSDLVREVCWVTRNVGNYVSILTRHEASCRNSVQFGPEGFDIVQKRLFKAVSDERNLRIAWDHVARNSGETAGFDGMKCSDTPETDLWLYVRGLRDCLRFAKYEPSETRKYWKQKKSGASGRRCIEIPTICDRVVYRAISQMVEPLLATIFLDSSCGYRQGMSRFDALAVAEEHLGSGHEVMLVEDIKDAFANVPQRRLMNLFKKYLPEPRLAELVDKLVVNGSRIGLAQGASLSSLLLNLYLHHHLDVPWIKGGGLPPLVRYADDLAVFCNSVSEADSARKVLIRLLRPAGLQLKATGAVKKLDGSDSLDWLGFNVRGFDHIHGCVDVRIGTGSFAALRQQLKRAIAESTPHAVLRDLVRGWISQQGPAWQYDNRDRAVARIKGIFQDLGLCEEFQTMPLIRWWDKANSEWTYLRYSHMGIQSLI